MAKHLIVVESPAKAKTIRRILGRDYDVRPSLGHIKDLPARELGVDVENGFSPIYQIIPGKEKVLRTLKNAAKKVEKVYLASDPDREGEAISWHIKQELEEENPNIQRLEFHEITPPAVRASLKNPRDINMNLVIAQQARRVLDRLVGYLVSPLLWEKVKGGLSAGRVQTVALRLICEREKEIREFQPRHYWEIEVELEGKSGVFTAYLVDKEGKKMEFDSKEEGEKILGKLKEASFQIKKITKKEKFYYPPPPLITSSLQQTAFNRFRFSPSRTMKIAQRLYEGVDVAEGRVGLITYMRTDSLRVSPLARKEAREWICQNWGEEYLPPRPPSYKSKKGAQEAHEAIRPTRAGRTPEEIKEYLSPEEYKLYTLIWERFIASQMSPARWEEEIVEISANGFNLMARGERKVFEGFQKVLKGKEEKCLPELEEGEILEVRNTKLVEKTTQPPPRFTEGSLIKELEDKGIGRPSTYATILQILKNREYVRVVKGRLIPTSLGEEVAKILIQHFPGLFEVDFTAKMEEDLDEIEEGKKNYLSILEKFYRDFSQLLKKAEEGIEDIKEKINSEYSIPCPLCGAPMVSKKSRYGVFLACSRYPECKGTRPFMKKIGVKCPVCGEEVVERRGKKGRRYFTCLNYPTCKFISFRYPHAKRNK